MRISIFACSSRCFTCSLRSLVRYRLEHSKIKFAATRWRIAVQATSCWPNFGRKQRHCMSRILDSKKKILYSLENFDCFQKTWTYGKIIYGMKSFSIRQKKVVDTIGSENNSQPLFVSRRPLTPMIDWSRLQDASAKINHVYKSFKLKGERLDFIFLQRLQLFSTPSLNRTVLLISRSHRRIFPEFIEKSIEKIHREIGCSKHA